MFERVLRDSLLIERIIHNGLLIKSLQSIALKIRNIWFIYVPHPPTSFLHILLDAAFGSQ